MDNVHLHSKYGNDIYMGAGFAYSTYFEWLAYSALLYRYRPLRSGLSHVRIDSWSDLELPFEVFGFHQKFQ